MTIRATATPYGIPAVDLLAAQIADLKADDPLTPVTVVVASNYVGLSTRRALAARPGGIANVNFTTFRELTSRLSCNSLTPVKRGLATAPLIGAAIRSVLAAEPGIFRSVAGHPATEQALATAYRELRNVPDFEADSVAACSPRAHDVVRICRATHQLISPHWYDEQDLMESAIAALDAGRCPGGSTIIHLLADITAGQVELIRALTAQVRLLINIGVTGAADADGPTLASWARADVVPENSPDVDAPHATHIISASDSEDEVRAAIRLVSAWAKDGIRLGRIALLFTSTDPYAQLVPAQLTTAGIPFSGTPVRSLGDMLFGRALQALLALPDHNFRRPDVLAILADAPIFDGGAPAPTRAWERLSRDAGVVSGHDWATRLPLYAATKRRLAAEDEAQGADSRAVRRRRDADRAERLSAFVDRLRTHLAMNAQAGSWTALAEWAAGVASEYIGDDRRRTDWPDDEQDCALRVEEVLSRLAGLDAVGGPTPSPEVFRQALSAELEAPSPHEGRYGAGVFVGHVSVAAGLIADRVVILGMAEGRFPPRRLEDSLLPDSERAQANGNLKLTADRIHDDHRNLLAAIASAGEAVFCWPRGDLRKSTDRPPSRWLLADAARLAGVPELRSRDLARYRDEPWFDDIASLSDGLSRATVFSTDQDLRLAAVARGELDHPVLHDDPTLARAREVIRARASDHFTRFDGNLTSTAGDVLAPRKFSATQLQTWAACPRAYFFQYVLDAPYREEPESRLTINPLDKGTLVHAILEEFVREAIDGHHLLNNWSDTDRQRLHEIAAFHFERIQQEGLTGRELLWHRDRSQILASLDRLLDHDSARLAAGIRPVAVEHKFDLAEVIIPGGRVIDIRGSIDRIDENHDGSVAIIDYKTGKNDRYKTLTESAPHNCGTNLQLYIYALASRMRFPDAPEIQASYWFTESDTFIGYPVTNQVEAEVAAAIDTIIDGISAGVFPAHPPATPRYRGVDCWYCTPDGLNSADLRREWRRKQNDPAMESYVLLSEDGDDQ